MRNLRLHVTRILVLTVTVVLLVEAESGVDDGLWLQQLYTATNGGAWFDTLGIYGSCNSGWDMTLGANPCSGSTRLWNRVYCNTNGRVFRVLLDYCNLSGTLPELTSGTGAMSQLQDMVLYNNSLRGPLPASWSSFPGLQQMYLSINQLTGSLPASWSSLASLQLMYLNNNLLTNTLPSSWSSLSNVQQMYLYHNKLDGPLPTSWSSLTKLQQAIMHFNQLNGTLPASWAGLTSLQFLYLYDNQITGAYPSSWVNRLTSLTNSGLQLYSNCLDLNGIPSQAELSWWNSKSNGGQYLMPQSSTQCAVLVCATGRYVNLSGGGGVCAWCPTGAYCPDGTRSIPCPAGTYNPLAEQSSVASCTACSAGTFNPLTGQSAPTACTSCAAGIFANASGMSTCLTCPIGSYCPLASVLPIACRGRAYCRHVGQTQPSHTLSSSCTRSYEQLTSSRSHRSVSSAQSDTVSRRSTASLLTITQSKSLLTGSERGSMSTSSSLSMVNKSQQVTALAFPHRHPSQRIPQAVLRHR